MDRKLSNSEVDRAGALLRSVFAGTLRERPFGEDVDRALDVLAGFRRSFQDPHLVVANALDDIVFVVAPSSVDDITGRPKRLEAMLAKLRKKQHMRLSQMEDIAGVRAKLPGATAVEAVLSQIEGRWNDVRVDDYVRAPRETGYRAIHAVVVEGARRVEIQLRTPGQNRWADTVEDWGERLGINRVGWSLKDGQGPPDLVRYFERAAYRIAVEEAGGTVDENFTRDFGALREQVRPYFRREKPVRSPED